MGKLAKRKQELLEVSNVCINCQSTLDLDQRYCPNCGGKRMHNRLTWRNLIEDFADRFLNIENAFLKTFLALFKRPEDVIVGYMRGMRKKYLPAFSYFAIAVTVAGFAAFVIKNWFLENMISMQQQFVIADQPNILGESFMKDYVSGVMEYQSILYFTFIPIMALISRLVFLKNKRYNLVEHFVIYLYAYSHIAMITTVVGLLLIWNPFLYQTYGIIVSFISIFYIAYALKRVFELDNFQIVLKTCLFIAILIGIVILLLLITMVVVAFMVKSGALDDTEFMRLIREQQEATKAAREAAIHIKDSIASDSINNVIERVQDSLR